MTSDAHECQGSSAPHLEPWGHDLLAHSLLIYDAGDTKCPRNPGCNGYALRPATMTLVLGKDKLFFGTNDKKFNNEFT